MRAFAPTLSRAGRDTNDPNAWVPNCARDLVASFSACSDLGDELSLRPREKTMSPGRTRPSPLVPGSPLALLARIWRDLDQARRRKAAQREIARLDERTLRDVGLTRLDVEIEAVRLSRRRGRPIAPAHAATAWRPSAGICSASNA